MWDQYLPQNMKWTFGNMGSLSIQNMKWEIKQIEKLETLNL